MKNIFFVQLAKYLYISGVDAQLTKYYLYDILSINLHVLSFGSYISRLSFHLHGYFLLRKFKYWNLCHLKIISNMASAWLATHWQTGRSVVRKSFSTDTDFYAWFLSWYICYTVHSRNLCMVCAFFCLLLTLVTQLFCPYPSGIFH